MIDKAAKPAADARPRWASRFVGRHFEEGGATIKAALKNCLPAKPRNLARTPNREPSMLVRAFEIFHKSLREIRYRDVPGV